MTQLCVVYEKTHFKYKDIYRLKVNGWRKISHANTNQRKQDNFNFRQSRLQRKVISIEKGYYIMIKGSILQEDIIILNVYVLNTQHQST